MKKNTRGQNQKDRKSTTKAKGDVHPAGQNRPEQQAGGPEHKGARADEDRNP